MDIFLVDYYAVCKNLNQMRFRKLISLFVCHITNMWYKSHISLPITLYIKYNSINSKCNTSDTKYVECTVQGKPGDGSLRGTCDQRERCHDDGVCIRGILKNTFPCKNSNQTKSWKLILMSYLY